MTLLRGNSWLLGLLILALNACSTTPSRSPTDTLLEHAQAIHEVARQSDKLWTGLQGPDETAGFIVYYRTGPALLYTPGAPIPGGEQIAPHSYLYINGLPRLTDGFQLNYELPDSAVTAVSVQKTPADTAELFFHEAFHVFQSTHFSTNDGVEFVADSVFAEPELRALLQVRRIILRETMQAIAHPTTESTADISDYLYDLQAIDTLMSELVRPSTLNRIYQLERLEGSAELVGLRAQALSTHPAHPDLDVATANLISKRLAEPEHSVRDGSELRLYSYGSGAALVAALQQINDDYESLINKHPSIVSAITHALPNLPQNQDVIDSTLSRYNFTHWMDWAYRDSHEEDVLTLQHFTDLSPSTLIIAIHLHSAAAAAGLDVNFSSGTAGFSQPEEGSYILPEPVSVSVHSANMSLLIEGTPTHLMPPNTGSPKLQLLIKTKALPLLCGESKSSREYHCELETLTFGWEGVQFEHRAAAQVRREGQNLYININER